MRIAFIAADNPLAQAADLSGQPACLARALAGQGHRVTIYARQDGTTTGTAVLGRNVSVEFISAGPARPLAPEQAVRYMPDLAAALVGRWVTKRPDVVHAFGWVAGLAALGAVRELDIPVVQTFGSLAAAESRRGSEVLASRLRLETLIGRKAAAVLAGSAQEAADLARLGVARPAIRVVPCGVDTTVFCPEGKQASRAKTVQLVALAGSGQVSSLQAVLQAMVHLPEAELVIAGGPDARHLPRTGPFRDLAQLANELKIRSRVKFAGDRAGAELAAVLRSADVVISTAGYEPSGAGAIQAMACGTAVIAAAVGGQADAVIDGTTGLLVAPDHAGMLVHRLRRLLATPALVRGYGIAAADRAKSRYSWERIARETAAAYERCLPTFAAQEELAEAEELEAFAVSV
jgi:glycosyltransferase involved in cell wall biosynthesis